MFHVLSATAIQRVGLILVWTLTCETEIDGTEIVSNKKLPLVYLFCYFHRRANKLLDFY